MVDVGKTLSKVGLWAPDGRLVERRLRANSRLAGPGYAALDTAGIEAWLAEVLRSFAALAPVDTIIPVAHGAGLAVLRDGRLAAPPVDYEQPIEAATRAHYDAGRDPFTRTGSPALPDSLNAGVQLHLLELLDPALLGPGATVVPWAQYWAWLLCGVAAAEVTSLGCHSDLWCPATGQPSALAVRRGWAERLAPLRRADEVLGTITPQWRARTGLSADVRVLCGLHDSNAALVAARGFEALRDADATVLSTGTWFVAMRVPLARHDYPALPESRDCLLNVDVAGRAVPSARFMGGREIEVLTGAGAERIDAAADQAEAIAALPGALRDGARVLPTFAPGCGPYPHARGRWDRMPADAASRRAAVGLYAALVADVSLDLIGACGTLVVEGRFAAAQVVVRALATLRPETTVYAADAEHDVSFGALRLVDPDLRPAGELVRVAPLDLDLEAPRREWRATADRLELAA